MYQLTWHRSHLEQNKGIRCYRADVQNEEKIGKTGKYKCCSFSLVSGLISLESPSASCPVVYPRRIKFLIFVVSSVNMFALEITKQKI